MATASLNRLRDTELRIAYFRFLGAFLLVFVPVYVGSGYLNALMPERALRLYHPREVDIPLIPWMVWPYLSLYTVYLLPLVHLDATRTRRLTIQAVVAVLVAGVVFLAVPSRAGFQPVAVDSLHAPIFRLIAMVDTPFNLVPSLHVTCAALILFACSGSGRAIRWLYACWLALLAMSTVLVQQHHLIDVVAGFGLAAAVRWMIPLNGGAGTSR